jgi:hypothetical protein
MAKHTNIWTEPKFYVYSILLAILLIFLLLNIGNLKVLGCQKNCDNTDENISTKCSIIGSSSEIFDYHCYYTLYGTYKIQREFYQILVFLSPILSFVVIYFILKRRYQ